MRRIRFSAIGALVGSALVLEAAVPRSAPAHDIPSDIRVVAFVHPDGGSLRLLVRVPLRAMRDIPFPLTGPGYLDLERANDRLREAAETWIAGSVRLYENGERIEPATLVSARVSLPSDRAFREFDTAIRHFSDAPLPPTLELYWEQALFDVWYEYPIASATSDFSIDPGLERLALRVHTILRFLPAEGAERVYQYTGHPGVVRLDPRWHQAAFRFVALGFEHILDGIDHLLFLFCLVIPFRRVRPLVAIVTAFTVGHSFTLAAAALGLAPRGLWFPPLVETLIAISIVYMAVENILGKARAERRWVVALGFGLVHGFGFSFALAETLQFAGAHLVTSLLAFNLGVEVGQVFAILLLVPALALTFRYVMPERAGVIVLSAFAAHTGWHWTTARGAVLPQYQWPALDAALWGRLAVWLVAAAVIGAGAWGLRRWIGATVLGPAARAPVGTGE